MTCQKSLPTSFYCKWRQPRETTDGHSTEINRKKTQTHGHIYITAVASVYQRILLRREQKDYKSKDTRKSAVKYPLLKLVSERERERDKEIDRDRQRDRDRERLNNDNINKLSKV